MASPLSFEPFSCPMEDLEGLAEPCGQVEAHQELLVTSSELQELVQQQVQAELRRMLTEDPVETGKSLGLSLHIRGLADSAATRTWYQGRKPDIKHSLTVEVVDKMGRGFTNSLTRNWRVRFHLVGGRGEDMDAHLAGLPEVTLVDGRAEVDLSNLVFHRVTSTCGDFCVVRATLCAPAFAVGACQPWISDHIKVISGRCKNTSKRSWESLDPESEIHQIPNVGDVFAKRFKQRHYSTVREIAAIHLGSADNHPPMDLLQHIQGHHQNSPFTLNRFIELVKGARAVCSEYQQAHIQPEEPLPATPAKLSGPFLAAAGAGSKGPNTPAHQPFRSPISMTESPLKALQLDSKLPPSPPLDPMELDEPIDVCSLFLQGY